MARQVYFDPFGSYVGGYQQGVRQEAGLQQQLREARDSDYKYNVTNPLELNRLQREDQVGAAAQPYRLRLPELGYRNARAETFNNELGAGYGAAQFGFIEPTAQALSNYTGYGYTMDPQGYFQLSDRMGNPYGPQLDVGGTLRGYAPFRTEERAIDATNYERQVQNIELNDQLLNSASNRGTQQANAQAALVNADARQDATAGRYGGTSRSGLPSWLDFAGRDSTAIGGYFYGEDAPQQPIYAQSPRAAQPIPGMTNTSQQLVDWMRASNPQAPAITSAEWEQMGPAGQEAYKRNYFPQLLNAGYGSPTTANPANYNPYAAP